ncbi:pancreatic triacylglycerol lipase-like isoform X2 [Odontomachus brunneus]|nr:pancreatic triacylglycerol lipase-like isoform X2 [Odontomachus brunneus]XP_032670872.1 pancreatic triacylglycerol lipase-like isoform X2 [Odontomachus brunneus]
MEEEEIFTELFSPMDYKLFKGLHVFDDDDNLVEMTFLDDPDALEVTDDNIGERVLFYLHTSKKPKNPELIYVNDTETLKKTSFDPKKPTRFVTHGWMNSHKSKACTLIRDAYLKHGDYNVIVIDWGNISCRPYFWASNQVKKIALYIADMLNFLQRNGMNMSETVMAGHSLGAHAVGLAARNCNGMIGYVVGMDPALPGYYLSGPGSRISSGDARHVEIIHTNAGLLGFLSAIGHCDYYPNGGAWQLGCIVDIGGACSHARSFKYFAESINSPVGFYATKCNNFTKFTTGLCKRGEQSVMGGLEKTFGTNGVYYLMTKASSPYAKGKK